MEVNVFVLDDDGVITGPVTTERVVKSDVAWQEQLTPDQYRITRGKGTEAPFCGNLLDNKQAGIYTCVCCELLLFTSNAKFESGTGWPSFYEPVARENVIAHEDTTWGMQRTEILCARCDAHLGHVFPDGPAPSGLRYCLNSESLIFRSR